MTRDDDPAADPSAEAVQAHLEDVLASPRFVRSERLSRFLRFIVENAIAGAQDRIKEYTIGIEVFDRDSDFDPRIDTVVRVGAGRLRGHLRDYYDSSDKKQPLRIEVPKGHYVPAFSTPERASPSVPVPGDSSTIVVLPFSDLSADADQQYLCDGIAEELIAALAEMPGLRVISRTSAFALRDRSLGMTEIGEKLGAGRALEGSVRAAGDQLRITVQLVDTRDDRSLWSRTFDRALANVFEIQDEIAGEVSRRVRTEIEKTPRQPAAGPSHRYTTGVEAYALYLKGRHFAQQFTRIGYARSIEFYQAAAVEDPSYAQPYAGLAESYAIAALMGWAPPHELMPQAKLAALAALERNDSVPEGHAALGLALFRYDYDWPQAGREYERALALSPSNSTIRHWYASYLVYQGRFDQAIEEARHAAALDPLSAEARRVVGDTLYFSRRYEETIEETSRMLEVHPEHYFAFFYRGMAREALGHRELAVKDLEIAERLSGSTALPQAMLGWVYGRAGKLEGARRVLEQLEERGTEGYLSRFAVAIVHLGLGDLDAAFEDLEAAYEARDGLLLAIKTSHHWNDVRSDIRFQSLLDRVGLPD